MGGVALVTTQFAFNAYMVTTLKMSSVHLVQPNVDLAYQLHIATNVKMVIL